MNIQHSSRSDSWGTPVFVLEMVRRVIGPIDFDPASSPEYNENVQASRYYTEADDSLTNAWPVATSLFCNPPGGKIKNKSKTALFWSRLMDAKQQGLFEQAIFMAFSLEAMQTTQSWGGPSIVEFPFCVPRRRLQFIAKNGLTGAAPAHSNAVVYIPGTKDNSKLFREVFRELGACS